MEAESILVVARAWVGGWGRGGERGGSEKESQAENTCVFVSAKGNVRVFGFVCLAIYQHQAGFEAPKPLNGCLTN